MESDNNGYGASFYGDKNVLELVVMITQFVNILNTELYILKG